MCQSCRQLQPFPATEDSDRRCNRRLQRALRARLDVRLKLFNARRKGGGSNLWGLGAGSSYDIRSCISKPWHPQVDIDVSSTVRNILSKLLNETRASASRVLGATLEKLLNRLGSQSRANARKKKPKG